MHMPVHFGSSLKWTVFGQSGRSRRLNWAVQTTETGQFKRLKVDGPEIQRWTVQRKKTVRSEHINLNGLNG